MGLGWIASESAFANGDGHEDCSDWRDGYRWPQGRGPVKAKTSGSFWRAYREDCGGVGKRACKTHRVFADYQHWKVRSSEVRLLPRQGPARRSPGRRKRTFAIVRSAQWLEFALNPAAYTLSIGRDNLDFGRFRLPTSSDDTQLQHSFVLLGHGSGSSRKPFKIPSASSFVTEFDPYYLNLHCKSSS